VHHDLRQGWAIEFYDSRGGNGAATITSTLGLCEGLAVPEGRKLVVVFVGFSAHDKHLVSSNDPQVQSALIGRLAELGIEAGPESAVRAPKPAARVPKPAAPKPAASRQPSVGGTHGWDAARLPSDTVEGIFGERAAFARRIIETGGMEELGRKSGYVNLSWARKKNIAQIHPQPDGIGLVLKYPGANLPAVLFDNVPVASLAGYKNPNTLWLDGNPRYNKQGPAVAFLIPDEANGRVDDAREWRDVVKLLEYAKTL